MKTKILTPLFLFVLVISPIFAQELNFSGYYENQLFPQKIGDSFLFQDYNKLRLDLEASIAENVTFTSDYIYQIYHGATSLNAFDFIPADVINRYAAQLHRSVAELRPAFSFALEDQNFLDNAFVTIYARYATIRIGKQQLPWGTGYAWNPTDIFHVKNLLDPTYEKVGVNAFKLEIPFSSEGMLTTILSVGERWSTSTRAVKVKHHIAGFDLSACYVEKNQEGVDFFTFSSFTEHRRLIGGDFSGELFGLGVWGEGAYNYLQTSKNFGQYLVGSDYTLESGLYLIAEYYYNDLGSVGKTEYTFADWMRLISTQGENLGREYLFLGERYPITELWNWANFIVFNLNDGSGILFPWLDYNLNDNSEILLVGYFPFGTRNTEFGEFGPGGFARIRVYF